MAGGTSLHAEVTHFTSVATRGYQKGFVRGSGILSRISMGSLMAIQDTIAAASRYIGGAGKMTFILEIFTLPGPRDSPGAPDAPKSSWCPCSSVNGRAAHRQAC